MAPSLLDPEPAAQVTSKTPHVAPISSSVDRHEEHQYLDLIREILEKGEHRPDR
jgi:thymidylate synthase